jgi:hypothetical protein
MGLQISTFPAEFSQLHNQQQDHFRCNKLMCEIDSVQYKRLYSVYDKPVLSSPLWAKKWVDTNEGITIKLQTSDGPEAVRAPSSNSHQKT